MADLIFDYGWYVSVVSFFAGLWATFGLLSFIRKTSLAEVWTWKAAGQASGLLLLTLVLLLIPTIIGVVTHTGVPISSTYDERAF